MSSSLKRYVTTFLSEVKTFEEGKVLAMKARRELIQNELEYDGFPTCSSFSLMSKKVVLLAPLVYRFFRQMEAPSSLSIEARHLIYHILISTQNNVNDENDENDEKEKEECYTRYLKAFEIFEQGDRKALQTCLFHNLWELTKVLPQITSLRSDNLQIVQRSIRTLLARLENYLSHFRWEKEYNEYSIKRHQEEHERVVDILEKAYWDMLNESIQKKDITMFIQVKEEIRKLLEDIPHPRVVDSTTYLEDLFDLNLSFSSEGTTWVAFFSSILWYLKEADSEDFDSVYDKVLEELPSKILEGKSQFIVYGLQCIYVLLLQLRAKINVLTPQF
jgi:hypothetical protein